MGASAPALLASVSAAALAPAGCCRTRAARPAAPNRLTRSAASAHADQIRRRFPAAGSGLHLQRQRRQAPSACASTGSSRRATISTATASRSASDRGDAERGCSRVSRKARSRRTNISASRSSITTSWSSRVPVKRKAAARCTLPLTRHLSGLRRGRPVLSARDSYRIGPAAGDFRRRHRRQRRHCGRHRQRARPAARTGGLRLRAGPAGGTAPLGQPCWWCCCTFFVGGLLLAFTPCVLPMVPILSGLIVGQGERGHHRARIRAVTDLRARHGGHLHHHRRAFAAAGKQVQAVFQQPWIIMLFAALFVAMALSMFGLFTLQMPSLHSDPRRGSQ